MKKKILILALALSSAVWAGDYEDGQAAFDKKNYTLAVSKFKKVAAQGDVEAQYMLGVVYNLMYENNLSVKKNKAEAIKWYTKAAEQGHADAQNDLGVMYQDGLGKEQNYAEALKWHTKSAEQGNVLAQHNMAMMYEFGHGVNNSKLNPNTLRPTFFSNFFGKKVGRKPSSCKANPEKLV